MRERFVPRLMAAKPDSLIDEANNNLDPVPDLECADGQRKAWW